MPTLRLTKNQTEMLWRAVKYFQFCSFDKATVDAGELQGGDIVLDAREAAVLKRIADKVRAL